MLYRAPLVPRFMTSSPEWSQKCPAVSPKQGEVCQPNQTSRGQTSIRGTAKAPIYIFWIYVFTPQPPNIFMKCASHKRKLWSHCYLFIAQQDGAAVSLQAAERWHIISLLYPKILIWFLVSQSRNTMLWVADGIPSLRQDETLSVCLWCKVLPGVYFLYMLRNTRSPVPASWSQGPFAWSW